MHDPKLQMKLLKEGGGIVFTTKKKDEALESKDTKNINF